MDWQQADRACLPHAEWLNIVLLAEPQSILIVGWAGATVEILQEDINDFIRQCQRQFHEISSQNENAETLHFYHATGFPFGRYADLLGRLSEDYNIFGLAHRGCWEDQTEPESSVAWHNYADDLIELLDRQKRGPLVGM